MIFFVVERFKGGDSRAVGERFRRDGRLMPDGVRFIASWMEPSGALCYQITEAPDRASLSAWIERWSDLIDFEVVEVEGSSDFWARVTGSGASATPYRERVERAVGNRDPTQILETTPAEIQRIVERTPDAVLRARPLTGKWTPCEIVGHLVDAEMVFGIRLRLVLAEHEPALPNWNQDAWTERLRYSEADPAALASQFADLRRMNLPLWLSLTPDDLKRGGLHTTRGRETLGEMRRITAGHDLLHLDQLRRYIAAAKVSPSAPDRPMIVKPEIEGDAT